MKMVMPLMVAGCLTLGAVDAQAVNSIVVESKQVSEGDSNVVVGVYITNDIALTSLNLCFEIRSMTGGAYFVGSAVPPEVFRFSTVALADGGRIGIQSENDDIFTDLAPLLDSPTLLYYREPADSNQCSGPVSQSWDGFAPFLNPNGSPDAVFWNGLVTTTPTWFEPGTDGSPPPGVGTPSVLLTFLAMNNNAGTFVIDTMCAAPANHTVYVDTLVGSVVPTFTMGVITIGDPPNNPPVVDDIPDQIIDEGGAFATIALDGYVSDLDNADAEMTWTATGQTELSVSISAGRVATITTPDPDWFGTETVTFTATDPGMLSDSDAVVFTVNPINDPPVLDPLGPKGVLAGNLLLFSVTASDIDNVALALSMENAPVGASLSSDGTGNGTFHWITGCLDTGLYAVTFIVSDGVAADTGMVNITVLDNPDVLQANPDSVSFIYEFEVAAPESVLVSLLDPGCGELPWEALASEPWLLVSVDTGTTPSTVWLDVDTTGLGIGEYDAVLLVSERVAVKGLVEVVEIPVHLSVTGTPCLCFCHGDPKCEGQLDVLDVVRAVEIVFRDVFAMGGVDCPFFDIDVNCDCVLNVLDVVHFVDKAFRDSMEPFCGLGGPCETGPPAGACLNE